MSTAYASPLDLGGHAADVAAAFANLGAARHAWPVDVTALTASVMTGLTTIPEPASCLLFGTGVSGLLALRRFRARRRS
ncbi:MAG: PEP-CTERM sorting domain-containing protein [Vicinamibacterales bacterium]